GQVDLAELLEKTIYHVKGLTEPAGRKIEVTMGEVPPVKVDPSQVQAALVEVLHNAVQATDEQTGTITIHAAYDSFSSRVVVSVSDNGCGMDGRAMSARC